MSARVIAVFWGIVLFAISFYRAVESYEKLCHDHSGDLAIKFAPNVQGVVFEAKAPIEPITCTANKPANITIFMSEKETSVVIEKEPLPNGASVHRSTCEATLVFDKRVKGVCHNGTYVCIATDSLGNTVRKDAQVHLVDPLEEIAGPRFYFGLQGKRSHSHVEVDVSVGASIDLECAYRSKEFGAMFLDRPFIGFYNRDNSGSFKIINESYQRPKKFEWSRPKIVKKGRYPHDEQFEGSRVLYIRNATRDDTKTYACIIGFKFRGCRIFRTMRLNVH